MIDKRLIYVSLSLIAPCLIIGLGIVKHRISIARRYTIGLIYIPTRAFAEYVNTALINKVRKDGRFIVKEFTAAHIQDLGVTTAVCSEAVGSNVDLLITTGLHCSKTAIVTAQKRTSKKPIIFLGVGDVVKNGLTRSLKSSGTNVAGVESSPPFTHNFNPTDLLYAIKPAAKQVLVPYGDFTAESIEPFVKAMEEASLSMPLSLTVLPIHNNNDTLSRTAGLISGHDSILYLEGDAIGVCGPGLGKLASQHNVTMLAGTIDGIKDAALSYVADPACLADMAFDLAKEILINKKDPGTLPIVQAQVPRNLMINTKLCKEQDLADIDIPAVVNRIRSNPQLAAVHDHIIVDGVLCK